MKVGLQVSSFSGPGGDRAIGPKLAEIGRVADDEGFTSFWLMDHFFQIEPMMGRADDPMLEAYAGLAYVAAVTNRIQLGALVSGVAPIAIRACSPTPSLLSTCFRVDEHGLA